MIAFLSHLTNSVQIFMMIFEAIKTLFGGIDKRSNIVIKIQTHLNNAKPKMIHIVWQSIISNIN